MNVVLIRTIQTLWKGFNNSEQNENIGELTLEQRIGIIGIGHMGEEIVNALIKAGYPNKKIYASRRNERELNRISNNYGINTSTDNNEVLEKSDIVLICVKPQDFQKAVKSLTVKKDVLYISIAAGITMEYLSKMLGSDKRTVKSMPNTGIPYEACATAYVIGKNCTEDDKKAIQAIFNACGECFETKEEKFHGVTYGACGPGVYLRDLEADAEIMSEQGLSDKEIRLIQTSNLITTANMLKTGKPYEELYSKVASKGGGTEAAYEFGLKSLYYQIRKKMGNAAIDRFIELSKN